MERLAPLSSEFDAFLFSSIGEDRDGISLSVVSLLARRDLDPWLEAAKLTALPRETATRQLTRLIQTITYQPLTLPDPEAIAIRLVALLPRQPHTDVGQAVKGEHTVAAVLTSSRAVAAAILLAIYLIFTVVNQLIRSHQAPSTQASAPVAPDISSHRPTDTPATEAHRLPRVLPQSAK
jgi:hypothetical protein